MAATLPYSGTRNDMRRTYCSWGADSLREAHAMPPAVRTAGHREPLLVAAAALYALAGAIEWVRREAGEDAADRLAAWVDNVMTNGDDHPEPMNADVMPDGGI